MGNLCVGKFELILFLGNRKIFKKEGVFYVEARGEKYN